MTTVMPLISALNTHPVERAKVVKVVGRGIYPDFTVDDAKLVAIAKNGVSPTTALKIFLKNVSGDMFDDHLQRLHSESAYDIFSFKVKISIPVR